MNRWLLVGFTLGLGLLVLGAPAGAAGEERGPAERAGGADEAKAFEGLWSGSWGGGGANGVVFQPVAAEMVIQGDRVELYRFPDADRLTGTVRFDETAKQMRVTPKAEVGGHAAKHLVYTYEIKDDDLTLTDRDKRPVYLEKCRVAKNPLANAQVELVAAVAFNDAGNLRVTDLTVLQAGEAGETYFEPTARSLKTKGATVLLVQETGCKKITIEEARGLLRKPTPAAVAYRHENRPPPHQFHHLWKEIGPPQPDSEPVRQTFARTLRPGTLVFILSPRANVVEP